MGSASHWFMNAAIALVFPVVAHSMSPQTPFVFFAVMTVVQFRGGAVRVSGDEGADAGGVAAEAGAGGLRGSF